MILKGKYWLTMKLPSSGTSFSKSVKVTCEFDGVSYTASNLYTMITADSACGLFVVDPSSLGSRQVGYITATNNIPEYYVSSRIFDFGDEGQEVSFTDNELAAFSNLFSPLSEDEFLNEVSFADVTNKMLDKIYAETMNKIQTCKPSVTRILNNSSGVSSVSHTISDYDILFIRAQTYTGDSSYTPLCYAIPAKMMFSTEGGVGSSGSFLIQVADNSKYSNFTAKSSGITYTAGNSGKIYQVYGLKFPTEVT